MFNLFRINSSIIGVIFVFIISGCGDNFDPCASSIVKRVESPNKKVEIVLVKKNCGATTSNVLLVYIVKYGEKKINVDKKNLPIFKADKVQELDVFWKNNDTAIINYQKARIFSFTNFWNGVINDNNIEISIIEKSLLHDK